jgi:multidrug efflux pump subunit AcrA (membrane-fusion protein)
MKRYQALILIGVMVLALVGCTQGTATPEGAQATLPPVVRRGGQVTAEALVEPARWSELSFRQGGTVAAVLVEEGAAVKEGDVLLRLNSAAAELAVQEAQAALELAEAELAETEAGTRPEELAIREAQLKAAQAAVKAIHLGPDIPFDGDLTFLHL